MSECLENYVFDGKERRCPIVVGENTIYTVRSEDVRIFDESAVNI